MIIYETWLIVVGVALSIVLLFTFDPYTEFIEKNANRKPFNCVLCTTLWVSAILFFSFGINLIYVPFAALIAEFTFRKLVNYE